ncbi:MAG: hypothetical protein LC650_05485 [Actinobacteria bacterium]|nr:hypothetical protein [Actinomycetota bacterium]
MYTEKTKQEGKTMGYVIYNKQSTVLLTRKEYITRSAAKAARTRLLKNKYPATDIKACNLADQYNIAEADQFYTVIEKRVAVENMMSKTTVYEGVNTPNFMSVGSEAYWSA